MSKYLLDITFIGLFDLLFLFQISLVTCNNAISLCSVHVVTFCTLDRFIMFLECHQLACYYFQENFKYHME